MTAVSHHLKTIAPNVAFGLALCLGSIHSLAQVEGIPRTSAGYPDFEGVWHYGSATPFERPAELGNRQTYNHDEALLIEAGFRQFDVDRLMPSDPDRAAPASGAVIEGRADANFITTRTDLTRIDGQYRTSLIVKPVDGRLPFRPDGMDIFDLWRASGIGEFDNVEIRPASERCLSVGGPMPPMVGWLYNANMRIVQTPDFLMLKGEMQGPRILALNGQHERLGLRRWMGESGARWEGDRLVVHTTNFRPEGSWFRLKYSDQMEVTEHFDLVGVDEIEYRYTLMDPKIYTAPHTVEMSIHRRPAGERLYEFACHEANYSLGAILRGARTSEKEAMVKAENE